ncbi:MAG: alginate lyase family protein [Anaerolineae bacterium]|nr:alginate lyase family protein [Anaerolineae bacterium]
MSLPNTSIPVRHLPHVAWKRIMRELRTRTAPRKPRELKVGASVMEIAQHIRGRQTPRFFGLLPEQAMLIGRFFPEAREATIAAADRIRAHRFDLLGSGERELGNEIDWHKDFKSSHRWPLDHYTRLQIVSPDGGFDVKVPWELSRFHHALRLGQAYLYTQDEFYAKEIVDQVEDWLKKNPYEFGVNWAGPMDVAIRAVNWLWALYLIFESRYLTDAFLARWLTSFQQHGNYLLQNLEDGWPHTNHLLANLAGLAYLGIVLPELNDAGKWRATGLKRFWEEIERQVYPDGTSYEASVGYHRLVAEMGLSVAALCVANGIAIPDTVQARLNTMLDVVMSYTQPDGLAPQIGDADNGRFLPLSIHASSAHLIHDHRYLLGLGSIVLERELDDWAGYVDPARRGWSVAAEGEWQDAFWYFASDAAARFTDVLTRTTRRPDGAEDDDWVDVRAGIRVRARVVSRRPLHLSEMRKSRGFEAGGWYVMRDHDHYMMIDAGGVGTEGAGCHAHNDTLSITLHAFGHPYLVDPGSYLYTSNREQRNLFRSTSFHNTLQIGAHEINTLPAEPFRLPEEANVSVKRWFSEPQHDLFDAIHTGYTRLDPSVVHQRQIWFDKLSALWVMHDHLSLRPGAPPAPDREIEASLWFHFAPEIAVRLDRTNNAIRAGEEAGKGLLILPLGEFALKASLEEGWYAPSYGIREPAPVARFSGPAKLPIDFILLLQPRQGEVDYKASRAEGRAALVRMRKALSTSTSSPSQ